MLTTIDLSSVLDDAADAMFYDDPDHVIRDEIVPLIDGDKFNEDLNIPDQKFVLPRALEITQALANILNMLPKIGEDNDRDYIYNLP